ncbi:hypothetical protein FB451DRAFT_1138830 [Mycena latifolia]|nr:hypothetical protein FB451DRAFT_1138830 [Mycena latifolia]
MSTTTVPRSIMVDDTDPAIQYGTAGWFLADADKLDVGAYGPVYNSTSHATITDAVLSFPFNGTAIAIYGTIAVNTTTSDTDPTWQCYVDKILISNDNPKWPAQENHWRLCDLPEGLASAHVLTMNVQSNGQPFYFDYIVYTPLLSVTLASAVLAYPNTDPAVTFGGTWQVIETNNAPENVTQTKGAYVALTFHGTSVSLRGDIPVKFAPNASSATYTIDGGAPVAFQLDGLTDPQVATNNDFYDVTLFTTEKLTSDTHNLVVTYEGDTSQTPLVVKTFFVTNTTTPSTSTSASPSPSPSAGSPGSPSPKHSHTGAIVGGTVCGLVVLALLVGLLLWCRRRRARTTEAIPSTSVNADFKADPVPASVAGIQYSYPIHPDPHPTSPLPPPPPGAGHAYNPSAGNASSARMQDAVGAPSSPSPSLKPTTPPSPQRPDPARPVVLRHHQDSGVRLASESMAAPEVVEVPPGYSWD